MPPRYWQKKVTSLSVAKPAVFTRKEWPNPRWPREKAHLGLPLVIFLLAVIFPLGFSLGPLHLNSTRVFLIVMILPLGLNLIRGKYGAMLATDVLFGLHFGWIILSLAINNPAEVIQNAGSTGIEFLGGYLLGRAYVRDRETFVALIKAVAAVVILCFPIAVFEAFTGRALFIDLIASIPKISAPLDLEIDRRLGLERVQMSFEHPIHWGLFCSVGTALFFVGLKDHYRLAHRLLVTSLVCVGGLLALSSGAILAIALQLSLIIWAAAFHQMRKRWLILLGLFILGYCVIDLLSNRTPIQVFMSYATFSAHSAYWRSTIFEWGMMNVWANPIFGLGLHDWVRPVWMHTPSVDNFWLLITMRYGIPAFAFLAVGYVVAIWHIGWRDFDSETVLWNLRRAWMFCFLGLTFTLTTVHIWGSIYAFVFFFFGSGMWLIKAEPADDKADQSRQSHLMTSDRYGSSKPTPTCRKVTPPIFTRFGD